MLHAVHTAPDDCDCPLVQADDPKVRLGLCGLCTLAGAEVVERYVEVWEPTPLIVPGKAQEDAA